ncbi:MAG: cation diffusion facilitator family transporter [Pedobacter sp.]
MQTTSKRKIRAARISMATATCLTLLKLVTGLMTGSMAVLSSAIDSLLDIVMSVANFLAIRQAEQPPDTKHPFGHGKFETIATIVQALAIGLSGGWVCYESVRRLLTGVTLGKLEGGMAVLAFSALVSWKIGRFLVHTARETESTALKADSLHFSMDVYTNLALLAGLVAIRVFNLAWLDPALSIVVALYIFYQAFGLFRYGLRDILDERLPETIREEIATILEQHRGKLLGYHRLRTRRAGSQKLIDFHLTLCKYLSVEEAHDIADHLETHMKEKIGRADITIHVEPCPFETCPGRHKCPGDFPFNKETPKSTQ